MVTCTSSQAFIIGAAGPAFLRPWKDLNTSREGFARGLALIMLEPLAEISPALPKVTYFPAGEETLILKHQC